MLCPYYGSKFVEYEGVTDGGGDYGTSVCDEWFCANCNTHWEEGCQEYGDDEFVDDR